MVTIHMMLDKDEISKGATPLLLLELSICKCLASHLIENRKLRDYVELIKVYFSNEKLKIFFRLVIDGFRKVKGEYFTDLVKECYILKLVRFKFVSCGYNEDMTRVEVCYESDKESKW